MNYKVGENILCSVLTRRFRILIAINANIRFEIGTKLLSWHSAKLMNAPLRPTEIHSYAIRTSTTHRHEFLSGVENSDLALSGEDCRELNKRSFLSLMGSGFSLPSCSDECNLVPVVLFSV